MDTQAFPFLWGISAAEKGKRDHRPPGKFRYRTVGLRTPMESDDPAVFERSESGDRKKRRYSERHSDPGPRIPRSEQVVELFLKGVPQPWRQGQIDLGLGIATQYESVIKKFFGRSFVDSSPTQDNQLIAIGLRLANFTKRLSKDTRLERNCFSLLILALSSYCQVLLKKGCSKTEVDEVLEPVIERASDRSRLLKRASGINRRILAKVGSAVCRATELFIIAGIPVSQLYYLNNAGCDDIFGRLTTNKVFEQDFNNCLTPGLTIPGWIMHMVRSNGAANQLSIEEICRPFGYDPSKIPQDGVFVVNEAALGNSVIFFVTGPRSFESDEDERQEAAAAGTNTGTSSALRALSTASDVASPTSSALLGEGAFSNAALVEDHRTVFQSHSLPNVVQPGTLEPILMTTYGAHSSFANRYQLSPMKSHSSVSNSQDRPIPPELLMGSQHSEELVPYSFRGATIDTITQETLYLGGFAGNMGPQLQLPTQVTVPDTAQSVRFAMKGDIDGLKILFSQRLASPRDVSISRGFSLVRWALYGGMHNYETVWFLLNQGALVDEDSYQHAWDSAYRRKCSDTELVALHCITLNPPRTYTYRDWPEDQQFPLIHQIIFGRSSKLLEDELDDDPDAVSAKDAMGRTALDWATSLAQVSNMRLLIDRGSPLDTMDVKGRTTVLHAVDSHNDDALRIILEAGADPNPVVPKGLFRSSPLTAATFGGLVGMIELLIKFGAKVDACNPEGWTPLTAAIINNHHDVLKLFINQYNISLKSFQPLPIIAESADEETMSILASSDLLKQTLLNGLLLYRPQTPFGRL